MAKHLVLVAGNIGAGKTSLTERIGQRLGWRSGYESVADNPYLSDFYGDMHAWGFPHLHPRPAPHGQYGGKRLPLLSAPV
jgi:deoxyadenosine/deoxycytidine kinase